MKTTILRESMTRLRTRKFTIRVWRQEFLTGTPDNADLVKFVRENQGVVFALMMALFLVRFKRVNAVEVLDKHGVGEVIYKNWP